MGHLGSSLRHVGSFVVAHRLFVVVRRLLSSCGAWAPGRVGSVVCGMRAVIEVCELSSCGALA